MPISFYANLTKSSTLDPPCALHLSQSTAPPLVNLTSDAQIEEVQWLYLLSYHFFHIPVSIAYQHCPPEPTAWQGRAGFLQEAHSGKYEGHDVTIVGTTYFSKMQFCRAHSTDNPQSMR
jgi:hypothetical protein